MLGNIKNEARLNPDNPAGEEKKQEEPRLHTH